MKFAFSKPTQTDDEQNTLFTNFRDIGYHGLQLKPGQYTPYLDAPARFLEEWGDYPGVASALITGGLFEDADKGHLRNVFSFGRAIGSERVVYCHNVPREGLTPDDIAWLASDFAEFGKIAQDHDLKLSLHNHYNSPLMYHDDLRVFFDAAEEGTVGLTIDTAHLYASGVTYIAKTITDMAPFIDNFHLKDFQNHQFAVLGRGDIDFEPIFGAIKSIGYDGWVSADEESGSELLEAMSTCYAYMQDGLLTSGT